MFVTVLALALQTTAIVPPPLAVTGPPRLAVDTLTARLSALRARAAQSRTTAPRGRIADAVARIEASTTAALDALARLRALPADSPARGRAAAQVEEALSTVEEAGARLAESLDQLGLPPDEQNIDSEADAERHARERQQLIEGLRGVAGSARDEGRRGRQEVARPR